MNIYPVTQNTFSTAVNMLRINNLPTDDITDTTKLFVLYDEHELIGVVGIELLHENALLRSLCVSEEKRSRGAGNELVNFIEEYAKNAGVKSLYLLTTTAESFFDKRNYRKINRQDTPYTVQQTTEFTSGCPASATVMKKEL